MMRVMTARILAGALLAGFCGLAVAAPGIQIVSPWIRAVPPVSQNSAAFLTVRNTGKTDDVLVSVDTPAAASAEMHEMSMSGGVMSMRQLDTVSIPAGGEVTFAPGDRHIMLFDLKAPLKPGAQVPLVLHFRKAGVVRVIAPVKADSEH